MVLIHWDIYNKNGREMQFLKNYQQQSIYIIHARSHKLITIRFCYVMARPTAVDESVEGGVGSGGKLLSGVLGRWWPEDLDKCCTFRGWCICCDGGLPIKLLPFSSTDCTLSKGLGTGGLERLNSEELLSAFPESSSEKWLVLASNLESGVAASLPTLSTLPMFSSSSPAFSLPLMYRMHFFFRL